MVSATSAFANEFETKRMQVSKQAISQNSALGVGTKNE